MSGKIRADADRRIIQNCPHGRGAFVPIHLFGSGFAGLGKLSAASGKPLTRIEAQPV